LVACYCHNFVQLLDGLSRLGFACERVPVGGSTELYPPAAATGITKYFPMLSLVIARAPV
jgi:hypothetical protein